MKKEWPLAILIEGFVVRSSKSTQCVVVSEETSKLTFGNVARLVLTPPAEYFVLDPWDPAFVLLVIPVL